jgi:hypothetical protein
MREEDSKTPPVTRRDRWATLKIFSPGKPGPPVQDTGSNVQCAYAPSDDPTYDSSYNGPFHPPSACESA